MAESRRAASPENPIVLVTGASRGIGAAIARRLAEAGSRVVVAARGEEACAGLAAELRDAGAEARSLALDVSDPDSIAAAAARAAELFDAPVDWLVNNAGIAVSAPLARTDDALVARHFDVNFHGPRRLMAALLPGMVERGYGRIVNVASSAALEGYPYVAAYCASKHALLGYGRAAARELARTGVAVGTVCPHYVDSPMLEASVANVMEKSGKSREDALNFFRSQNPSGELVAPDAVAGAVLELLRGDETGVVLELDGGPEPRRRD